jgi:hypothetical protein
MLSLLLVPVNVSDSCVPVTLSAQTVVIDGNGNIWSTSDIVLVNNSAVIVVVPIVIIIANIKTSFDILISYGITTRRLLYPSLAINLSQFVYIF